MAEKKRLLVATDEMEVGGSQRQIAYLLGGIDRARWQPELVFFRNESFLVKQLREQGVIVHHVPKRGRLDLGFVFRYAALLRRRRYDLVHAFSLTAELWTWVCSLPLLRPPALVSSVRGLYMAESDRFWRIKRFVLGRSAATISNSRAGAATAAARARLPRESFDVVPNGIVPPPTLAANERQALRDLLGVPPGRSFGLFVGRLVKEKNLECLVRALARLPQCERPWIALAGNGPLRERIEALREAAGLAGDLRFLGERSDATRLMNAADFLVLPSAYEGMSNVLMEAMSLGCPVLASEVGGNPELIEDGRTGLLFDSDDDAMLARKIGLLAGDAELRARLSRQAVEHTRTRYSIEQLVAATTAVYERCLSDGSLQPALARNAMMTPPSGKDA
ncbi:glycosyltransferase family 4 protein [Pseudoxanthomonas mexicana]|uniref:glycosyltransferase family 4 protein n=1 Tax=Pseudoxanthomonas mexicana TaxID=128785 RepID=UPI00398B5AE3